MKKTVQAEEIINYCCNCPDCGETLYSEYAHDWNADEMIYTDQEIQCDECGCEFYVTL
jgi:DNA-directed RNA polymerase subunit RPC12/RpoP